MALRLVEYLQDPPDPETLQSLIAHLGLPVREVLRRKGTPWAALDLGAAHWSDAQLVDPMRVHPILINRPIALSL